MEEVSIFHRYLCWSMADLGVGFPGGSGICLQCRGPRFNLWVGKIPWRREWLPTLLFLPEKSHGQSSLVGYSPWGHKESDMTEQLSLLLHVLLQSCDSANRDKSPIQRVPGIGLSSTLLRSR